MTDFQNSPPQLESFVSPDPDLGLRGQRPFPIKARIALAFMFAGGALVVCGALLAWLWLETTPVTYVSQIHKDSIQSVAKASNTD